MKEKTIYALLMTMIPGLALGAEKEDTHVSLNVTPTMQRTREVEGTPITKEIKRLTEEAMSSLPATPVLEARVNQKINRKILPPEKADLFFKLGFEQEQRKKEERKRELLGELKEKETELRLEKEKESNKQRNEENEGLKRKLAENDTLIMKTERSIEEKLKENETLSSTIDSLKETIGKQSQDLEQSKMILEASDEFSLSIIAEMKEEVVTKTQNLEATKRQLRELEKKAKELESELQDTKFVEQDLKKRLQGIVERQKKGDSSSFSTPPNTISLVPSAPSASISDASVENPSSSSSLVEQKENKLETIPPEETINETAPDEDI
jgi:hypothetical protein